MSSSRKSCTSLTDKQQAKRTKIIDEVLSTEKSYIESLEVLVSTFAIPSERYLESLRTKVQQFGASDTPPPSSIPDLYEVNELKNQHNRIFSNIAQLLGFNKAFYGELMNSFKTNQGNNIGGVFAKYSAFFKMYSTYTSNFDTSRSQLQEWMESQRMGPFIAACEMQESCFGKHGGGHKTLKDFLIQPVQRIPRYKMLLNEIIKLTPSGHVDHENLHKAESIVANVATSLNDDMKQIELRKKTIDVITQFDALKLTKDPLLQPSRFFVKEGVLKKVCKGGKKDFLFVLFNDCLIYGSPKLGINRTAPNGEKIHSIHRRFSLTNTYFVRGVPGFMEGFILVSHTKSFYVDCGSAVAANSWIDEIDSLFGDLEGKIVTKQSSWRKEGNNPTVTLWGLGDEGEGGENETETWKLNQAAASQGKGLLNIISKEEVDKIGEGGIALISKEGGESPGKSRNSLGSIARRMSHKFNISGGGNSTSSTRLSDPPPMMPAPSGGFAPVERRSEGDFSASEVGGGGRGHSPIVPPAATGGVIHKTGTARVRNGATNGSAGNAFRQNQFIDDSRVRYTGEFRVTVSNYGLGLDLQDEHSPYPDHPSPSIVKVASFPNLPNGCKSAAASAGILKGDYIVMVNGVGVSMTFHVEQVLKNQKIGIGSVVVVRVRRGGVVGGGAAVAVQAVVPAAAPPPRPKTTPAARRSVPPKPPGRTAMVGSGWKPQNNASGDGTADLLGLGSDGVGGTLKDGRNDRSRSEVKQPTYASVPARRSSDGGKVVGGTGAEYDRARTRSTPIRRQNDWMKSAEGSGEMEEQKRISKDFGTKEGWDPAVDIVSNIDFLGLMGRTRTQYLNMSKEEREKLKRDVGLG